MKNKMKRVLLVVAIGVSFAPPVLAVGLAGARPNCTTGELGDECVDYRATQCQYDLAIKEIQKSIDESGSEPKSGVAQ